MYYEYISNIKHALKLVVLHKKVHYILAADT